MANLKLINGTTEEEFTASKLRLPTSEGTKVLFSEGEARDVVMSGIDFSAGDATFTPLAGTLFKSLRVTKPSTLDPSNIRDGVEIAGIRGTMQEGVKPPVSMPFVSSLGRGGQWDVISSYRLSNSGIDTSGFVALLLTPLTQSEIFKELPFPTQTLKFTVDEETGLHRWDTYGNDEYPSGIPFKLVAGDQYTVRWDGASYPCTALGSFGPAILEEQSVELQYEDSLQRASIPTQLSLVGGCTYIVQFDDRRYACEAIDDGDEIILGNYALLSDFPQLCEEPFLLIVSADTLTIVAQDSSSTIHTLSIFDESSPFSGVMLGNAALAGMGENSGEPFLIGVFDNDGRAGAFTLQTDESHEVTICRNTVMPPTVFQGYPFQISVANAAPSFSLDSEFQVYSGDFTCYNPLVLGETYKVIWDQEEYICTAVTSDLAGPDALCLGNLSAYGGSGNGEPFVIGVNSINSGATAFVIDPTDTSESHEIEIYIENVHPFIATPPISPLEANHKCTVTWDGVEYQCTAFEAEGILAVGNMAIASPMFGVQLPDTGEPFVIGLEGNGTIAITRDAADSHSISITRSLGDIKDSPPVTVVASMSAMSFPLFSPSEYGMARTLTRRGFTLTEDSVPIQYNPFNSYSDSPIGPYMYNGGLVYNASSPFKLAGSYFVSIVPME